MKRLDGIKACVFDAYGTLFDFASAAARCQDVPDQKLSALTKLWRQKQLQYTWLRSLEDSYADFWQLTGDALNYALDSLDIASPELHAKLMDLYLTPAPFPEVASVLTQLRHAGFKTAVLSNGSVTMLNSAVRAAGLSNLFDAVLSADAVKVFKPHPRVYAYGLEKLGLTSGPGILPVIERLGRIRRLALRPARCLVQPLWPARRAAARRTRLPDP